MYSQLIYYIVALLIFTVQEPGTQHIPHKAQAFGSFLAAYLLFVLVCYLAFRPLIRATTISFPPRDIATRYHRLQTRLSILALGFLGFDVYVLSIKQAFESLPGFQHWLIVSGTVGLCFYLIHLIVIWFWAYPVYKHIYGTRLNRFTFVQWHLSFHSGLLLPWFLIALLSDLLEHYAFKTLPQSELGQIFLFGLVLLLFLMLGPGVIVRLWHCEPLPPCPIRDALESFCRSHRFRIGNFLLWPLFGGELLTAAVMGMLPKLRYILITQGLLRILSIDELKAVIAHEMGHVRRYHAVFYLVIFIAYALLAYTFLDPLLLFLLKHQTILNWALDTEAHHETFFALANSVPVVVLMILYFRYLFGYFLRNSERQADLYALTLVGHPFTLVSSLQKIAVHSGHIEDVPSWHHFSIRERIDFLMACYENPALITRHHRKLYGSALLFLVIVAGVAGFGMRLENSRMIQGWRNQVEIHYLEHQLDLAPDSPQVYVSYGGLLMERHRWADAEDVLLQGLQLHPDHAGLLNNLAWLYATAPKPLRNPKKALELALKAASLDPKPYILDTLAEAYFVNGAYRDALQTIRRALAKKPQNMAYYRKQEAKFLAALKRSPNSPRPDGSPINGE